MDLRLSLSLALAAATALPAQDPKISQTFRSGADLDLLLRYTALEWKKGDKTKERAVGELRSRTPLTIGGQRVEQGSHELVLARSGGQPQLLLKSLREWFQTWAGEGLFAGLEAISHR